MFTQESLKRVVVSTLNRAKENAREMHPDHRDFGIAAYNTAIEWVEQADEIPVFDRDVTVETHCTAPEPGDLFRDTSASSDDETWMRFLGGEMTGSRYYAMAYADPEDGVFEDVHVLHDSATIELVTLCRHCEDNQASVTGEIRVDGRVIPGPFCSDCFESHESPGERA